MKYRDENRNKIPVGKRDFFSYCISMKTYRNLLTLVRVIVGYAQSVVNYSDTDKYVQVLYFNQSIIEGLFSCTRKNQKIVQTYVEPGYFSKT